MPSGANFLFASAFEISPLWYDAMILFAATLDVPASALDMSELTYDLSACGADCGAVCGAYASSFV